VAVYSVNGLAMKMPALLTSESTRPNRSRAVSTTRSAVAGSAMSPATVARSSASCWSIEREFATTA
jgi:hypothetical protein